MLHEFFTHFWMRVLALFSSQAMFAIAIFVELTNRWVLGKRSFCFFLHSNHLSFGGCLDHCPHQGLEALDQGHLI